MTEGVKTKINNTKTAGFNTTTRSRPQGSRPRPRPASICLEHTRDRDQGLRDNNTDTYTSLGKLPKAKLGRKI